MKYDADHFRKLANLSLDERKLSEALHCAVAEAERLRAMYEHALRCHDPEVCVENASLPPS